MRSVSSAAAVAALFAGLVAASSCSNKSTNPSPQPCTYTLSTNAAAFDAGGGSASVSVTTQNGCTWTAAADAGWVSVTGGTSGTGSGIVTFAVSANDATDARTASLMIGGKPVSIHQDGHAAACTYRISPSSASTTKDGGAGSFDVTTGATCAWTATSSASWLTLSSADHGTGNGTVKYTAARNADPEGRAATIRLAGETFTLQQSGDVGTCRYSVSPVAFSPCMPATELETAVQTQAGCPWTSTSGASWISITAGQSASGPGTARFAISSNYDAPRQGIVMLRWPAPTAGQNVSVSQAGCTYGVSPTSFTFPVGGGSNTFYVVQQSTPIRCGGATQDACVWSADSKVGWITITSSMPKRGDEPVHFTVAPNGTGAPRTGTITVKTETITITQAGS